MKVLVIGAVAAGTKAAAKLKRELGPDGDITILTKSTEITYAGCGLPYYIGGHVERSELMVNTPESYTGMTQVPVLTGMEVLSLDRGGKSVHVRNLISGEESDWPYDKLVIATGASPVQPRIPGADLKGVHVLRTPSDADAILADVEAGAKRAVVVGGGYVGLEAAENLMARGLKVSVVEMVDHIMPGFDGDFAEFAENRLADAGIPVFTGDGVTALEGDSDGRVTKLRTGKRAIKTDLVLLSIGIRPATAFLEGSGIDMSRGAVIVDEYMRTNDPDVYAVGDCAIFKNYITGQQTWLPMGSTANIQGRICAQAIAGTAKHGYRGSLGSVIVHLPGLDCGKAAMSDSAAKAAGFDPVSVTLTLDDKAHFYPGADLLYVRLTADRQTRKLLGAQAMGVYGVDKFADIAVTAITMGACVEDIEDMDLVYAPPFATAMDAFTVAVNVLIDKMDGRLVGCTWPEAKEKADWVKLYVGKNPINCSMPYYHVSSINGKLPGVEYDSPILLCCAHGKNSYVAQNRMRALGYTNTCVLEGGVVLYPEALED